MLGCDEKHVRLYKVALYRGTDTLPALAKAAHLQRSTAYIVAADMVRLGLLVEDHKTYRKQYMAAEPEKVLRMLEAKHRRVGRDTLAFKELLPDLRAAQHITGIRPRVRTYEGNAGLLAIWKDILTERQEVLMWTNQLSEKRIFDARAHQLFIQERIGKQIPVRVLVVNNQAGRHLQQEDAGNLRTTRLLPVGVEFTSEMYIYGDKVAVLDAGTAVFGVITENSQIAQTQRTIFEMTWSFLQD
jgi:hypothetical protein